MGKSVIILAYWEVYYLMSYDIFDENDDVYNHFMTDALKADGKIVEDYGVFLNVCVRYLMHGAGIEDVTEWFKKKSK